MYVGIKPSIECRKYKMKIAQWFSIARTVQFLFVLRSAASIERTRGWRACILY